MLVSNSSPASEALDTADVAAVPWLGAAGRTLRRRWWLVALMAGIFLLAAIVYLRAADYSYAVVMRVAPAQSAAAARENSNISALSNLASLTGITVPSVPATPFRLFIEGLQTREVADRLARDPKLLQGLFPDEWDANTRQWHDPERFSDQFSNAVNRLVGAPVRPWSPPDGEALQRLIGRDVIVEQTLKSPVAVIAIDSIDPAFGVRFLAVLHETVDAYLREKALARGVENIAYLDARLQQVAGIDHRMALLATLSDQKQRLMLTRNPAPYAAEHFGDITVSPLPTRPRPLLVAPLAFVLGGVLGILLAFMIPPRRRRRP